MIKKNIILPVMAAVVITGIGTGVLSYAQASHAATASSTDTNAQTSVVTPVTSTATSEPATANDPADAPGAASAVHQHAPMGGDGNITAINGTTITMSEEADEGGASYTVDASNATITKAGVASTLAAFKVGDKIFVTGNVTGTTVAATAISNGHGQHGAGN